MTSNTLDLWLQQKRKTCELEKAKPGPLFAQENVGVQTDKHSTQAANFSGLMRLNPTLRKRNVENEQMKNQINAFAINSYRIILSLKCNHGIHNEELSERLNQIPLALVADS